MPYDETGSSAWRFPVGKQSGTFRIEAIFAGMHSSYWLSMCAFSGFMAVFLAYYGFSDSQIGLTASLISAFTIVFQLGVSSFSDANAQVPLKKIITLIYLLILGLVAVLAILPLPLVLMMLVFSLAGGLANGLPGLYNAQIIQFVNAGMPLNLGWPRGVSALLYALFAFLLGLLLERFSPSILMPISILCLTLAILMVLVMPRPDQVVEDSPIPSLAQPPVKTSLKEMLGGNRVLALFLLSAVFMSAGQSNTLVFLNKVVNSRGGNEAVLGLAMFLQAGVEMPAMFLSPLLLRRFRARAILGFSVTFYFIKSLMILFSSGIAGVYLAMVTSIFCFGLYGITSVYFVNGITKENEKVRAQSLVTASGALSAVLSNPVAGWVVQNHGIGTLNLVCAVLQLVAAALMVYCAVLHARQEKLPMAPNGFISPA